MSDVRFQVQSSFREFLFRELSAVAGAITITCLRGRKSGWLCDCTIRHQLVNLTVSDN
ncbi:hypothetical protein Tsubulata_047126 [Turnera subulata]|uniref:Uncharacterized protein n=1 Tax=Turnera subulata TaxID=218843 RepID=A0A9Q0JGJ9_9ROSI|nr:hypothetical protein Tsubulata_047126 [Turnera subulata]